MSIDSKEMAKWLFDQEKDFESLDQFKEELAKKYVAREVAVDDEDIRNKVTGKTLGSLETKFKRAFNLTEDDVKGKKLSDLFEVAQQRIQAQVDELKTQAQNSGKDDETYKAQLAELKRQKGEYETLAGELTQKLEQKEVESQKAIENYIVNQEVMKIKANVPWSDSVNSLAKKGFDIELNEKYIFALSDGKLTVTDKQGNQIKNDKGTAYLSPEELVRSEAEKAQMLKKAGDAGKQDTPPIRTSASNKEGTRGERFLHPRAIKHREELNAR
jgi:hypothetical protein